MWSSLVDTVKTEYHAIRWPHNPSPMNTTNRIPPPDSVREALEQQRQGLPGPVSAGGRSHQHNIRISTRTVVTSEGVKLQGWPSRGGIIELENALGVDFDFLGLNPLDPPLRRDADQDAEDEFCRGLLRLGATWWSSTQRRKFVLDLQSCREKALDAVEADDGLDATRLERGWVRVAWPSKPAGSLCVLECENLIRGRKGTEVLRPRVAGLLMLARTMDERCEMLKMFGGKMYGSLEEYEGETFLKAWEDGYDGEGRGLEKEAFVDPEKYGGHPDDALRIFVQDAVE